MEQRDKSCPIHQDPSSTPSSTSKGIPCSGYQTQTTTELISKYRDELQPTKLEQHRASALEALKENEDETVHFQYPLQLIVEELTNIEEKISHSQQGIENDSKLITEAIQYLRGVGEKAFTAVLLSATQKAVNVLDIEKEITEETEEYKRELERLKKNMKKYERPLKRLGVEREWLNKITTTEKKSLDEDLELTLSLCFENSVITPPGHAHTTSWFRAFPSVQSVFDIREVDIQEFVDVGSGVNISKPIPVEMGLKGGNGVLSSLSHRGVLAVSYCEFRNKVQLTDLVDGRQIDIKVENWTHTGFYDDSIVILTYEKSLRVCSVEDIFLNRNVDSLKRIGDVGIRPWSDISLLHSTRVLVFTSTSYIPYEFNVDTGAMRELDIGKKIDSFVSLTGINVGVKGVFKEFGNNHSTYSLNTDNSTSLVLGYNPGVLCTFIPSSSDSRDIKKGMKIYSDGNFFTDTTEKSKLTTPFIYVDGQSIVRLYRDIFLVYYKNISKWCLVKIIVP